MRYRKIYQVIERRWQVSPGFRFTDFSGWRSSNPTARRRPLCLVMEDRQTMRRICVMQEASILTITCIAMDAHGRHCGQPQVITCHSIAQAARELEALFVRLGQAA